MDAEESKQLPMTCDAQTDVNKSAYGANRVKPQAMTNAPISQPIKGKAAAGGKSLAEMFSKI